MTTYGNSNGKKEERKSAFLNNSLIMDICFLLLRIKTFVINFPNITYCFPLLFDHYYFRSLEQLNTQQVHTVFQMVWNLRHGIFSEYWGKSRSISTNPSACKKNLSKFFFEKFEKMHFWDLATSFQPKTILNVGTSIKDVPFFEIPTLVPFCPIFSYIPKF